MKFPNNVNKKSGGIYKIENLINGKVYLGSSISLYNRFNSHKSALIRNKHGNKHLNGAWNKYGEDNFIFEVLEIINTPNILLEREQYYLDLYPKDQKYNIFKFAGTSPEQSTIPEKMLVKINKEFERFGNSLPVINNSSPDRMYKETKEIAKICGERLGLHKTIIYWLAV